MHRIAAGVYCFSRLSIFQYILVDQHKITLIDTGLAMFSAALWKSIWRAFPDHTIDQILLTHADGDHCGGIPKILEHFPEVKIATSLKEAAAMENGVMSRKLKPLNLLNALVVRFFSPFFKAEPVIAGEILRPGQILPIMGGLSVIDSSGHTPQHLSFYLPGKRILFAGDSIVNRGGIPSPADGYNCWDLSKAVESFERQMSLGALHICCGHSTFSQSH